MAVYKVPQDVEAEDKLIGPFGFRQFIYLLIAAGAGGLTFLFVRAPVPIPFFSVLTVPVILIFVILALPLRKDQPMEIYIGAILRFMLKPKRRLWMNDGTSAGVMIDIPNVVTRQLAKDITQDEAVLRLTQLSRIVDSRGWAAKNVDIPMETPFQPSIVTAANFTEDIMDENAGLSKAFDDLLTKQKQTSRETAIELMQAAPQATMTGQQQPTQRSMPQQQYQQQMAAPPDPRAQPIQPPQQVAPTHRSPQPHFNPHQGVHQQQQVLSPLERMRTSTFRAPDPAVSAQPAVYDEMGRIGHDSGNNSSMQKSDDKSMTLEVTPDIMRLANNKDLSIQAIAHEAHRAEQNDDGEVVIKLH